METGSDAVRLLMESPRECARIVAQVTDTPESLNEVISLKREARRSGLAFERASFEQGLLRSAAIENEPRILGLPVHESVKKLMLQEFRFYSDEANSSQIEVGGYLFATGCRIVSLRRFPAGPLDWELSGLPRSWLKDAGLGHLPRLLWFIATRMGGFRPLLFIHVARKPKNRLLLLEREVLRAYYRVVRSLELQPGIKGIAASAWFHDPQAVKENPHLACLSRPYMEAGGLIFNHAIAPADSGFLEHNLKRKQLVESGQLRYRFGAALWPRDAAIDWARKHPELES